MAVCPGETVPQPEQPCTALAVNLAQEDIISLAGILRGSCWRLREAQTCQEALCFARNGSVPVVLCEPHMSDGNWNTLMGELREVAKPPAVVVVSRLADERFWVEVLNLGGYDVLVTPFDRSEVFRVLFLAWTAFERKAERVPDSLKKALAGEEVASRSEWHCASSER
jgi:DNA-binding response OmpR family regulator